MKAKTESSLTNELAPILWVTLNTSLAKPKPIRLKALCDSGASSTMVRSDVVSNLKIRHENAVTWSTAAGSMTTTGKCKINFILPKFHSDRMITWDAHVHTSDVSKRYDMIIGRDLQQYLKLDIAWSTSTLHWDGLTIPMRPGTPRRDRIFSDLFEHVRTFGDLFEHTQNVRIYSITQDRTEPNRIP